MRPTEEDLKQLEEALAANPTNTNLMNKLALGYFVNPDLLQDNEDVKLLEKAYQTKKTVKSSHNLAWFYYKGYGENRSFARAMEIEQECISMNPKSFYPYQLYGQMLLRNNQFLEAIKYLEIAYSKENCRYITDDLGVTCSKQIANNLGIAYAQQGDLQKSHDYFIKATNEKDIEYKSKYNLAITKIQLGKKEDALIITEEFKKNIVDGNKGSDAVDYFEVAYLYYLLNDYETAYYCCKKCDWSLWNLWSWKHVPYLIFIFDIELFKKLVASKIEEENNWIKDNKDNDEYWQDDTEEEKQQELAEREYEINRLTNLEAEFALGKPNININDSYLLEYCGCLLFDCHMHDHLKDDE